MAPSARQVADLNDAPRGYRFHGFWYTYNWASVEHLLGKVPDSRVAAELGCHPVSVRKMRRRLRIPKYRKTDSCLDLLGEYPDAMIAEMKGLARETVTKLRLARGIPPCPKKKLRRRDVLHVRHMRNKILSREE